ncbi:holo-ACP synthase [Cellulomonas fimi]|uniref:Holo-[acyl-carrier-protein] synthase n=1 Tax=Cellulomonas fimi (strain ATCC 484 / DSM 20113 / JCM 1341 / CCUG 24087 / LMG 16345 / NBRC 15513 / NCIMB 8980 / NCTC 7547 / NRS-133) TaxID=590998 RepID=F4H216_CELFA|nr:holo-ACP synthase [Cellulomonas fimi]AEE45186.1 4'-phosphopantetheinyl transferase [Cellulomonas fimi ATCC 484]NNH06252.1 holo-ACP synthase [Cellulomonas fimi]VEH28502.1 Holo-[acyl-carrier-protein] synthase [Cellulomonas fimi]
MIVGVGIDVVDIARFVATLHRAPALRDKLFTPAERVMPETSLAARFAAKEALAKALGAPPGMHWHDAAVPRTAGAQPVLEVRGTVAARAAELGVTRFHLSISHDAGIASAVVVAERD